MRESIRHCFLFHCQIGHFPLCRVSSCIGSTQTVEGQMFIIKHQNMCDLLIDLQVVLIRWCTGNCCYICNDCVCCAISSDHSMHMTYRDYCIFVTSKNHCINYRADNIISVAYLGCWNGGYKTCEHAKFAMNMHY